MRLSVLLLVGPGLVAAVQPAQHVLHHLDVHRAPPPPPHRWTPHRQPRAHHRLQPGYQRASRVFPQGHVTSRLRSHVSSRVVGHGAPHVTARIQSRPGRLQHKRPRKIPDVPIKVGGAPNFKKLKNDFRKQKLRSGVPQKVGALQKPKADKREETHHHQHAHHHHTHKQKVVKPVQNKKEPAVKTAQGQKLAKQAQNVKSTKARPKKEVAKVVKTKKAAKKAIKGKPKKASDRNFNAPATPKFIIKQAGPSQRFGWVGPGRYGPLNLPNIFKAAGIDTKWIPSDNIFEAGLVYPDRREDSSRPVSLPGPPQHSAPIKSASLSSPVQAALPVAPAIKSVEQGSKAAGSSLSLNIDSYTAPQPVNTQPASNSYSPPAVKSLPPAPAKAAALPSITSNIYSKPSSPVSSYPAAPKPPQNTYAGSQSSSSGSYSAPAVPVYRPTAAPAPVYSNTPVPHLSGYAQPVTTPRPAYASTTVPVYRPTTPSYQTTAAAYRSPSPSYVTTAAPAYAPAVTPGYQSVSSYRPAAFSSYRPTSQPTYRPTSGYASPTTGYYGGQSTTAVPVYSTSPGYISSSPSGYFLPQQPGPNLSPAAPGNKKSDNSLLPGDVVDLRSDGGSLFGSIPQQAHQPGLSSLAGISSRPSGQRLQLDDSGPIVGIIEVEEDSSKRANSQVTQGDKDDAEVFYIFYENENNKSPQKAVIPQAAAEFFASETGPEINLADTFSLLPNSGDTYSSAIQASQQQPVYYDIPIKVEESGEGFTPPSAQDIRTIYVPIENAINIPDTFDINVGTSFGYKGAEDSGFPNFPTFGGSNSPGYDNPISSYDAPIIQENSYSKPASSSDTVNVYENPGSESVRPVRKPQGGGKPSFSYNPVETSISSIPFGTRLKPRLPYNPLPLER